MSGTRSAVSDEINASSSESSSSVAAPPAPAPRPFVGIPRALLQQHRAPTVGSGRGRPRPPRPPISSSSSSSSAVAPTAPAPAAASSSSVGAAASAPAIVVPKSANYLAVERKFKIIGSTAAFIAPLINKDDRDLIDIYAICYGLIIIGETIRTAKIYCADFAIEVKNLSLDYGFEDHKRFPFSDIVNNLEKVRDLMADYFFHFSVEQFTELLNKKFGEEMGHLACFSTPPVAKDEDTEINANFVYLKNLAAQHYRKEEVAGKRRYAYLLNSLASIKILQAQFNPRQIEKRIIYAIYMFYVIAGTIGRDLIRNERFSEQFDDEQVFFRKLTVLKTIRDKVCHDVEVTFIVEPHQIQEVIGADNNGEIARTLGLPSNIELIEKFFADSYGKPVSGYLAAESNIGHRIPAVVVAAPPEAAERKFYGPIEPVGKRPRLADSLTPSASSSSSSSAVGSDPTIGASNFGPFFSPAQVVLTPPSSMAGAPPVSSSSLSAAAVPTMPSATSNTSSP